jgi:5'-3' exonuclease
MMVQELVQRQEIQVQQELLKKILKKVGKIINISNFFCIIAHMKQVIKKSRIVANNIDVSEKTYTILVDGNSLLKSSLVDKTHINDNGEEYGAVFLFLRRLGNLLLKKDFSHCIVAWDGEGSGLLRYKYLKEYKANRDKHYGIMSEIMNPQSDYDRAIADYCKKTINYHKSDKKKAKRNETDDEVFQRERMILQNILEELFVRQYIYDSVEGDDIIAYYCKKKKKGEYIVIVSEDRDLSQLIKDDICIYIPSKKIFVSPKNDISVLGIPSSNVVLKKIICGDDSDNIKGIKGWGEATLEKHYPQIKAREGTLNEFLDTCRQLVEERTSEKKKPLKCLENALNKITDGEQGNKIYEINKKIIDLSEPLLTEEAKTDMDETMNSPIDPDGRDLKNVYRLIDENGMPDLLDERKFGSLFSLFERIRKSEIEFYKKKLKEND